MLSSHCGTKYQPSVNGLYHNFSGVEYPLYYDADHLHLNLSSGNILFLNVNECCERGRKNDILNKLGYNYPMTILRVCVITKLTVWTNVIVIFIINICTMR